MSISPIFYPQIKQNNFKNLQSFAPEKIILQDEFLLDITQKDVDFLNTFNPDKLLFNFRVTAGLPNTKAESSYSGWENTRIGGHTMGHYLAAAAQAVARGYGSCCGKDGLSLQQRLEYLIDSLYECQKALGTGFIFGATMADSSKPELQFDKVESENASDTWVPWYTVHKIMNGLVECYKSTKSEKALQIAEAFGEWAYKRTEKWTPEVQKRVLSIEYGGMNDCIYELYKCAKQSGYKNCNHFLRVAHSFDEEELFKKVIQSNKAGGMLEDVLNNRHANTTIPKFVGAMNRYLILKNDPAYLQDENIDIYLDYAKTFWKIVVNHHSYITGGNSECEHFGQDDILDKERSNTNCETCNTHNMLKLSRMLFMATGERQYADYYENTFINAILASVNAENGMTLYFQPMATGCFKTYCNPDVDKNYFWCCTGTGLENFTKLGDSIYFYDEKTLIVNQFISSKVEWDEKGVVLSQKTNIPFENETVFTVEKADETNNGENFILAIRSPDWNYQKSTVFINGICSENEYNEDSGYILINRNWKKGDTVKIEFSMQMKAYPLPDNNQKAVAFKYGPVVLAAELGRDEKMTLRQVGVQCDVCGNKYIDGQIYEMTGNYGGTSNLPLLPKETVFINQEKNESLAAFFENINTNFEKTDEKLHFKLQNTNWENENKKDFIFSPYYLINNQRYGIYWIFADKKTENQSDLEKSGFKNENLVFIEGIGIGYGAQTEGNSTTYPFMKEKGAGSYGDPHELTRYAKKGGSFSYVFKVKPGKKNYLVCTFLKEDNGKSICIKSGFIKIASVNLNYTGLEEKYTLEFELPEKLTKKGEVRIAFMGKKNTQSARLASPVNTAYAAE